MTTRSLVLLLSFLFLLPSAGQGQDKAAVRKDRHALLIGVTYYENLPAAKHLAGPANDVVLVRKLLIEKLQFSPDQVVTLSEQDGKDRGKDFLPSRANIEREFKRLALVVQPGDQVVIHMCGHGSQQPENKASADPEPDGLDEIFLPRDTGAWNAAKGTVANCIIDDEMAAWLKAIRDKKCSVWITFDSCHSGTMIRGADDQEKSRDLDPINDLGVPRQAIKEAIAFAAERDGKNSQFSRGLEPPPPPFKMAQEGGVVAIYACQANEVTFERELPLNSPGGKVYGLLSYSLCKVLTEATEKSKEPITYSELARRIHGQYVQAGRSAPTPLIEGVDRDRQVLGDKVWPGRSSMQLLRDRDGYRVNAGALHGLTPGSILAVTPPPGQGDTLLGHVRIKEVGVHSSDVEPCSYAKTPLAKTLPAEASCRPVFIDVGDQQLRVAVDARDAEAKPVPAATRAELEKIVAEAAKGGDQSLLRLAEKSNQADWLVRVKDGKVVLVPGSGWAVGRAPLEDAAFGPAAIDANLGVWIKDALRRIARAENLKRLAAAGDLGGDDSAIRVGLRITRKKDAADKLGSIPVLWPAPDLLIYDADRLVFDLANKGKVPIDVTLLYVDSGFGIDCLFPRDGEINRLRPGESIAPRVSLKFSSKTAGLEQLVVIALKAKGQPADFSQLVQPTLASALNQSGKRGGELQQSLDTPLGRLLKRGMFGVGTARGASDVEIGDYAMFTVSFSVRPQKR